MTSKDFRMEKSSGCLNFITPAPLPLHLFSINFKTVKYRAVCGSENIKLSQIKHLVYFVIVNLLQSQKMVILLA